MNETPNPTIPALPGRYLAIAAVVEFTGLGKTSIYENMNVGTFPKPHRVGKRAKRWWSPDLLKWQQDVLRRHITI